MQKGKRNTVQAFSEKFLNNYGCILPQYSTFNKLWENLIDCANVSICDTGSSNLVFCDILEGCDGVEGERGSIGKGHVHACGWLTLMCGRDQRNVGKQLSFSEKKHFGKRLQRPPRPSLCAQWPLPSIHREGSLWGILATVPFWEPLWPASCGVRRADSKGLTRMVCSYIPRGRDGKVSKPRRWWETRDPVPLPTASRQPA